MCAKTGRQGVVRPRPQTVETLWLPPVCHSQTLCPQPRPWVWPISQAPCPTPAQAGPSIVDPGPGREACPTSKPPPHSPLPPPPAPGRDCCLNTPDICLNPTALPRQGRDGQFKVPSPTLWDSDPWKRYSCVVLSPHPTQGQAYSLIVNLPQPYHGWLDCSPLAHCVTC